MKHLAKHIGIFLLAFCLGTLYGIMIGMLHGQLRAALIAWPVHIVIFWILLAKFRLFRFIGFVLIPPLALLGCQWIWSINHPVVSANSYLSSDRSHYTPRTRIKNPARNTTDAYAYGWNQDEILIGADGFRADPVSLRGNPKRCRHVLIGDSMIYGNGLPYSETLGPQLARRGIEACVFGVPGNSPADYLSTLTYVADRIEPGAHVAFYIYAYNDFVDLRYYLSRRVRALSNHFQSVYDAANYFDKWRRSTIIHTSLRAKTNPSATSMNLWQYEWDNVKRVSLRYPHDPQQYREPKSLAPNERQALELFFSGVAAVSKGRSWHITMAIHPDNSEIYANLARRTNQFVDLDPRRSQALAICQKTTFECADISRLIYEKTIAAGANPYFSDDRHFSPFGTRIVAESFAAQTRSWDLSGAAHKQKQIATDAHAE
jgi:hypothetical protein